MDDDWFEDSERLYPDGMDGPTVRTPSVDVPEPTGDVFSSSPIARLFVLHVFVWNAVVLFLSLGVMLIYFRNDWNTGQRLLIAGAVLAVYGIYRWPRGDEDEEETEPSAGSEPVGDEAGESDESPEAGDAPDSVTGDGDTRDARPDS